MNSKPNKNPTISKEQKELTNNEINATLDDLRKEQKKEREQNKNLKSELQNLVNELFTLPELRSRAHRLLNQAVEAATQELATKNISKTKLTLTERPMKPRVYKKSMPKGSRGSEADNELSNDYEDFDTRSQQTQIDGDTYTIESAEGVIHDEIDGDTYTIQTSEAVLHDELDLNAEIAKIDKTLADCEQGVAEISRADENDGDGDDDQEHLLNETDIETFQNSTNLFEDILWHEEDNMAKNISDANELLLLKALDENFQGPVLALFNEATFENPFKIDEELASAYAEKLKKLEETTENAKKQISLQSLAKEIISYKDLNGNKDFLKFNKNANSECICSTDIAVEEAMMTSATASASFEQALTN